MEAELEVNVADMLTLQLSELEMLQSMFPNAGELVLDDPMVVTDIQSFIDNDTTYESLQSRIGFSLKLDISQKGSLEVVCHLPHEYPAVPPEVFLRSTSLSRSQHRRLSDHLQAYILDLDRGELGLGFVTQWLQDHAASYMEWEQDKSSLARTKQQDRNRTKEEDHLFSRMWIYSHHIYSKIKRKDILDFADELHLTGFSMPGKPGIVCIEGYSGDVEDFWHRLRRMQWKKLTMKEKEDAAIDKDKSVDSYRKFGGFEEKHFEPRQGKGRGAHMDRGLLYQFLEQKGCGHIFQVYFGVEGRVAEEDTD